MNGLVRDVLSIASATSYSASARLTNFNPDKLLFIVDSATAPTKAELAKILVTINFKNSVGSGIAITANLPLDIVANLNDYLYGFGLLGSDKTCCFVLDIGKYCLRADDEITFNVATSTALTNASSLTIKALDTKIGKEQLLSYKFISAQASQAYQQADVLSVYAQIASASDSVFLTIDDFFGSNNISELAVVGIGSALGSAEDFDSFGVAFDDPTGMGQPVTVRAGSANERLLFKVWNFDVNRVGFERTEYQSAKNYATSIKQSNPSKYKCLSYFYGK